MWNAYIKWKESMDHSNFFPVSFSLKIQRQFKVEGTDVIYVSCSERYKHG